MGTRSRYSKWRRHPEPPPDILSKKLRSKLLRWRRRQISPELLFSAWMKTSAVDNPGFSVITVDSSSGGEASFNSSRASFTKSEISFAPEQHSVEDSRNRNDFFLSVPEPPPDILSKKLRSKLLHWRPRQISPELLFSAWMKTSADDNPGFSVVSVDSSSGGEASFNSSRASCTKSEITFPPELYSVEDSRNRNEFVSVAAEPESYADSFMKHALKISGECSEAEVSDYLPLQFVKSGSVGETTSPSYSRLLQHLNEFFSAFSYHHSEIVQCSEPDLSDHTLLQFIGSGSQFPEARSSTTYSLFLQHLKEYFSTLASPVNASASSVEDDVSLHLKSGSVGETPSPTYSRLLQHLSFFGSGSQFSEARSSTYSLFPQHLKEYFSTLASPGVEDDVSLHLKEYCTKTAENFFKYSEMKDSNYAPLLIIDSGSQISKGIVRETPSPTYPLLVQYLKEFSMLRKRTTHAEGYFSTKEFEELVIQQHSQKDQWITNEFARSEDSEEEQSYQMLRKREGKQAFLRNYAEEFGEMELHQRLQMEDWIMETIGEGGRLPNKMLPSTLISKLPTTVTTKGETSNPSVRNNNIKVILIGIVYVDFEG